MKPADVACDTGPVRCCVLTDRPKRRQPLVRKFHSASAGTAASRRWPISIEDKYLAGNSQDSRPLLPRDLCIGFRHTRLSDPDNALFQRHAVLSFRVCCHFACHARTYSRCDEGLRQARPLCARAGGDRIRTPRVAVRDHRRRRNGGVPVHAACDSRRLRACGSRPRGVGFRDTFQRKRRLHHALVDSAAIRRRMALCDRPHGCGARMPRRHLRFARRRSRQRRILDRRLCRRFRLDGGKRQRRYPQPAPERRGRAHAGGRGYGAHRT